MATFAQLADEVRSSLAGYTMRQDRIGYLTEAITPTATELAVGGSNTLAKGEIEIDEELLWVESFSAAANTLTVAPGFGRGYNGTTPAPHAQYAQVTYAPTFPRQSIKRAINDTIQSVYPKLFAIQAHTFTFNAAQTAYSLPDDAKGVLYASWQTPGSSREWLPIRNWRIDTMANIAAFDSTTTINIYDGIQPGRTVQVVYISEPASLTNNTDDFELVTGLPATCRDVIVMGAAYRLLSFVDPGRLTLTTAEADLNDSKIPSTAGGSASKYLFALYQQRLQEEALKQSDKFPIRLHYTR
jgi:hypothetical protein